MERFDLELQQHTVKIGDECGNITPNVTEDCIFFSEGKPIGFFLKSLPLKMGKISDLANHELLSKNVPKSLMKRSSGLHNDEKEVLQYSTILGSIPPKPHMRRPYPTISSVHSVATAKTFIKAMLMLVREAENLIKEILPEQYEKQIELFKNVPEQWRFGKIFTSSISNYNISAPFHKDNANIKDTVNVIITKRRNSSGGNLHVPDYGATIDQCDNSILVYPAWRNVHGVTPINPTYKDGYRNSLIFYPLKAFYNK